jgi:hypothetical protein
MKNDYEGRSKISIDKQIAELASDICPDYPDVGNLTIDEHLYAIEQAYIGVVIACNDWSYIVKELQNQYDIPSEDINKLADKAIERGICPTRAKWLLSYPSNKVRVVK